MPSRTSLVNRSVSRAQWRFLAAGLLAPFGAVPRVWATCLLTEETRR